jgi:osmotically-inducible protein OsmY
MWLVIRRVFAARQVPLAAELVPMPAVRAMSEMELNDRLLTALERNPYLSRRNLRFETSAGRVTLRGVVGSYYQKQMAQEVLRRIDGVAQIQNELEVAWAQR